MTELHIYARHEEFQKGELKSNHDVLTIYLDCYPKAVANSFNKDELCYYSRDNPGKENWIRKDPQ